MKDGGLGFVCKQNVELRSKETVSVWGEGNILEPDSSGGCTTLSTC